MKITLSQKTEKMKQKYTVENVVIPMRTLEKSMKEFFPTQRSSKKKMNATNAPLQTIKT